MNIILRIKNRFKRKQLKNIKSKSSLNINNPEIIATALSDPDFPWLISFPRTGSHWLRMIMELYFEKPSLVEVYYYKDAQEFTCIHRHDPKLKYKIVRNLIYLYRNPVDTIYSQMSFRKEDLNDRDRIEYWANIYGRHLAKWLIDAKAPNRKTVISYEEMKTDMNAVFKKLCKHFGYPFQEEKLSKAMAEVSKEKLKEQTTHTPQVVNLSSAYQEGKKKFKVDHKEYIENVIYNINPKLKKYFPENKKKK